MLKEFDKLTEAEQQQMLDAISLITILVAGADGQMDHNEIEWAKKMTNIRSYDFNNKLNEYFRLVGVNFTQRIEELIQELPNETEARQAIVTDRLAALNPVLHKIDEFDAALYYKNFLTFAKHVAESSGGLLRFMSIGPKEAEVIDLPMLDKF